MLITPDQVRDYSVFRAVKNRPDPQLSSDIIQAQADIFAVAGHRFDDTTKYPLDPTTQAVTLPEEVSLAFIKTAEYYALINSDEALAKGFKSEKIGDYTYQVGDSKTETFSLQTLLAGHIQVATATGSPRFRLGAI